MSDSSRAEITKLITANDRLDGCVSWFRAYHIGRFSDNLPPLLLTRAVERGLPLDILDPTTHGFYELSTLRSAQVARGKLREHSIVQGTIDVDGVDRRFRAEFDLHLLAHRSGFVVLRPTARFNRINIDGEFTVDALHAFERTLWNPTADLEWHWQAGDDSVTRGWGRNFLNYVFLDLFARWQNKRLTDEDLQRRALETAVGCDEMHRMYDAGDLEHPYPLTFGLEVQLALPPDPERDEMGWKNRALDTARQVLQPLTPTVDVVHVDAEPDASRASWFFDENRALAIVQCNAIHRELGVIDADRTQVIEYLTVRRAALSAVRRATQQVLIAGLPVARRQVGRWRYLVTATTDDYVLDARVGSLLEMIRRLFAISVRLRDLDALETQVRTNLNAFQSQIDTAAERTGGLVAALVGAGALVIGLQDAVKFLVAVGLGVPQTEVADKHTVALVTAQVLLIVLAFAGSYLVIRRTSDNLRTVRTRRVWRS